MYFRSSGALIPRLERALEIDDNILRYMSLRMDAKMIRHYEASISKRAEDEKAEKAAAAEAAAPAPPATETED
jgi:small subunit ribosomal protein S6